MRGHLGVCSLTAMEVLYWMSGFAQKMYFFHKNSGLSLSAAISFLLDELPTREFSDLRFDASNAFQSSGFNYVRHPGSRTRNQDNALDIEDGEDTGNKHI